MYKRLDNGAFRWPRSADEAMAITDDQYRMLMMQRLEIVARHPISELKETPRIIALCKMPKIKKYQNCKNDVYQPDEKGYPQTVFSHSICYRVNRKTVVDNTSEKNCKTTAFQMYYPPSL